MAAATPPLFDFALHPLENVMPWGKPEAPYLSWFGLTDGYYAINTGAQRHYRYTPEIIAFWAGQYPDSSPGVPGPLADCTDYQIVRLYEDVLDVLPNVLAPVPAEAHALLGGPGDITAWLASSDWVEDIPDESPDGEALIDLRYTASRWFGSRTLTNWHLQAGPDIYLWRHADIIHFAWDHTRLRLDDYPDAVWTATSGTHRMPAAAFMEEIASFHDRLMAAMAERIHLLHTANPIPHVHIDMEQLAAEHEQRTHSLEKALSTPPEPSDWSAVLAANSELAAQRALRRQGQRHE